MVRSGAEDTLAAWPEASSLVWVVTDRAAREPDRQVYAFLRDGVAVEESLT